MFWQGPEGNILEHAIGAKTESLDPPHNYVPWIVVDGEHSDKVQQAAMDNLLDLICQLYKVKWSFVIPGIEFELFRERNQPNVMRLITWQAEQENILSNCLTHKLSSENGK